LVAREVNSLEIVGVINIDEIVMGAFQSAYLGYYGTAQFARQGLMTDVLSQAIKYAFDDIGLHRLEANIQTGNIASLALVKKLHFTCEGASKNYLKINGEWHDHQRWALLNQ
ncbi:MAG: GNAT family N-acetyltransferase, partial [Herminiimonas sp.]|nr:GNAT family N-acetyltransferase [Herminiimonas sp.]